MAHRSSGNLTVRRESKNEPKTDRDFRYGLP